MRIALAGFGFLGSAIQRELATANHDLTVIRRSVGESDSTNIRFVACDLSASKPFVVPEKFDAAIFCLAPPTRDESAYSATYVDAQRNFIACIAVRHYTYISSTAVYPTAAGAYREDDARATSPRTALLLEAETLALGANNTCVLRLAGLYSAERTIYRQTTEKYAEDRLVHFIHRDDAARAVVHAIERELTGIYNVHDGNPQWRSDILRRITNEAVSLPRGAARSISGEKFFATGFAPRFDNYFAGVQV